MQAMGWCVEGNYSAGKRSNYRKPWLDRLFELIGGKEYSDGQYSIYFGNHKNDITVKIEDEKKKPDKIYIGPNGGFENCNDDDLVVIFSFFNRSLNSTEVLEEALPFVKEEKLDELIKGHESESELSTEVLINFTSIIINKVKENNIIKDKVGIKDIKSNDILTIFVGYKRDYLSDEDYEHFTNAETQMSSVIGKKINLINDATHGQNVICFLFT